MPVRVGTTNRIWRDLPDNFGPYTTCYKSFRSLAKSGCMGQDIDTLAGAHDTAVQMIDTSIVRVHQARCLHHPEQKAVYGTVTRRTDQ